MSKQLPLKMCALLFCLLVPQPRAVTAADREYDPYDFLRRANRLQHQDITFVVRFQDELDVEPVQPLDVEPLQPLDVGLFNVPSLGGGSLSEVLAGELDASSRLALSQTPAAGTVTGGELSGSGGATDVGEAFAKSLRTQTVSIQRRSPVALDPHIRGYHVGQIYTQSDGILWSPVRQDLDTMLNKVDPQLVQNANILPGPYGLRYGPGFAFIDVSTISAPRYVNGFEAHNRFGMNYRENGGQIFGVDTVYGGSADYGFIFSYGNRTGSDYRSGNGTRIPSSYHGQNVLGQFGVDLSPQTSAEFRYQRLDQTDTEYAGQFFDVDFLVTDAFSLHLEREHSYSPGNFQADAWYNRTRFEGDTENSSKETFNVINRVESAFGLPIPPNPAFTPTEFIGITDGDVASAGGRLVSFFGYEDDATLRMGADIRFLEQEINETFEIAGVTPPPIFTNLPRSHLINPGVFTELSVPVTSYWRATAGARADWAYTTLDGIIRPVGSSLKGNLSQNDILYAFYLMNEVEVSENWTTQFAFGYAERVPTLTERYADGIFLGIIQSGFSNIIGTPELRKERNWQIDVSADAEYENWRGRASGFHAWIFDYIAFQGNVIEPPTSARLLQTINTDLATLTGFELYGEVDLNDRLLAYGSAAYVDGRNREFNAPLTQISPLSGRLGLILNSPEQGLWSVDLGMRMVANQDRLGSFREAGTGAILPLETETGGFSVGYVRALYNWTENIHVVAGVENLFDRNYLEHLNIRYPEQAVPVGQQPPTSIPPTAVFSPGLAAYLGVEWTQ